jgi:hypothetical protein
MPATGLTLKANWIPNSNTPYKVEHYQQNLDGVTYPSQPTDVDNLSGTTASRFTPETKTYHGFTAPVVSEVQIAADGSTVVRLEYKRNTYKITYNSL